MSLALFRSTLRSAVREALAHAAARTMAQTLPQALPQADSSRKAGGAEQSLEDAPIVLEQSR